MSGNRLGAPRRRFQMPHRIRWANDVTEETLETHGYAAGLAGTPIYLNPTKGDITRPIWVKAYRRGAADRHKQLRIRKHG